MYIDMSKNILLIFLTIGFLYLFFNQKNSIEKFSYGQSSLEEPIRALSELSSDILSNNTLKLPGDVTGDKLTVSKLNIDYLNILPKYSIIAWGGKQFSAAIPKGWAECNGKTVNGTTTPDLRGKFILGSGNNTDSTKYYQDGDTGGEDEHILTEDEMPKHGHRQSVPLECEGHNCPGDKGKALLHKEDVWKWGVETTYVTGGVKHIIICHHIMF